MSPLLTRALLLVTAVLVTAKAEESRFNQTKSIVTATTVVTYMPPMMILGKSDGNIDRCPVATPKVCEEFHAGDGESKVSSTAVHGEFLYASLASGDVLRCVWQRSHSCTVFHRTGSRTIGLAVAAGFLHVALHNGTIMRCELATPHSCHEHANLDHQIFSLTAAGSVLYIGSECGQIDTCSATSENNCSLFYNGTWSSSTINAISVMGHEIIGVRSAGVFQICDIATKNCDDLLLWGGGFSSTAVYNGKLYLVKEGNGEIRVYDPIKKIVVLDLLKVPMYAQHEGAISISFS